MSRKLKPAIYFEPNKTCGTGNPPSLSANPFIHTPVTRDNIILKSIVSKKGDLLVIHASVSLLCSVVMSQYL